MERIFSRCGDSRWDVDNRVSARFVSAQNNPMKLKLSIGQYLTGDWYVLLTIGVQSFSIGPDWDTHAEALWYKKQFARALKNLKKKS